MADKGKKSSMEIFAPNDKADYYSGTTSITVNGKNAYELKGKFLDDLHNNAFIGTNGKDMSYVVSKLRKRRIRRSYNHKYRGVSSLLGNLLDDERRMDGYAYRVDESNEYRRISYGYGYGGRNRASNISCYNSENAKR
ncbi:hypothetical protein Tco_0444740 [Tanacetum coccineum]